MTKARKYLKGTLDNYFKELADRKAVPGGGSASALTASLGAALNLMVLNYNVKGSAVSMAARTSREVQRDQRASLARLSLLIDEDCRAFQTLMDALASGAPAQEKYMAAAEVPMKICRECCASMNVTMYLSKNVDGILTTDIGCAAHLLNAAFYSAGLNVEINLKYIKDGFFVSGAMEELKTRRKNIDKTGKKARLHFGDIVKGKV